ncbi:hypothetical protein M0Q50_09350 [bacterium]|jgi:hypothetical protein|nr:hypothetical protein [bacterium]
MKKFINYIKENSYNDDLFLRYVDIDNIDIKFDFINYKQNLFYYNDDKLICFNNSYMKTLQYNSRIFDHNISHVYNLKDVSIKYIYKDFKNIFWCANITSQDIMKNFNI